MLFATKRWEDLPPNKPVCPGCHQHAWYVSQRVQRRALTCPDCHRYYLYVRELNNEYALHFIGRFKSNAELERRIREYIIENHI